MVTRTARRPAEVPTPARCYTASRPQEADSDMTVTNDWNAKTITAFRANQGRVGGAFEGAPITLVHHRGRKSGRDYVTPMMYLADERDAKTCLLYTSDAADEEDSVDLGGRR